MRPHKASPWPLWIQQQLIRRGISDERVLKVFSLVSRKPFLPFSAKAHTNDDAPVGIGCGQTVSQPFVIALSLQALELKGGEKVLDVGTGSGFQAVLLSFLAKEVYTIEIHQKLYIQSRMIIEQMAKAPVHTREGDGSLGWANAGPFDGIVVGSRAPKLPPALTEQLAPGGRLVIPIGGENRQILYKFTKKQDGTLTKTLLEQVRFVPLLGKQGIGRLP